MRLPFLAFGATLLTAAIAACGARSSLYVDQKEPIADAGIEADAPPDAPPDAPVSCVEQGITFIYLIGSDNELLRFDPATLKTTSIGLIDCPNDNFASPFSMGVDRQGTAFVLFNDGNLYRVSTKTAECEATDFIPGQQGFTTFGMGFSTNEGGPDETLFVADSTFSSPSSGLASIDTETFELNFLAPFIPNLGSAVELTGTGDGRLFAFFLDSGGGNSHLAEVSKFSGIITQDTVLPIGLGINAFAFAFWGGDFFLFTSDNDFASTVTRYHPADASLKDVATLDARIVGAGVSTCAPK